MRGIRSSLILGLYMNSLLSFWDWWFIEELCEPVVSLGGSTKPTKEGQLAGNDKGARLGLINAGRDDERMLPDPERQVTYFARLNFRNDRRRFGIRRRDRRSHMLLIGRTGAGKSSLIETMIRQDMTNGEGLALLDPHGDLVERVLTAVPDHRTRDLIYFNVPDQQSPLGFNPLEPVRKEDRSLAASGLLDAFKKTWADSWGPRLEHILRNALLALFDQPEATMADILRLLHDETFRKAVVLRVSNRQVYDFWMKEYAAYPAYFRAEAISPIQNKVGAFLANPILNRILTQPKSAFDLRQVMDEGKILLVNLAKGRIGEDVAALLGALLVSRLQFASLNP